MPLSQSDIKKLNSIAKVLGNALAELEEIRERINEPIETARKRRNLKKERMEKYKYEFLSGQVRK